MNQTKKLLAAFFNIACILLAGCLFMAACESPAAPGPALPDTGGLAARDIADGGLTLYWDPVPEAEGYRIYWSEGDRNPESAQVIETISTDTTYIMGGLNNGASYYFWVLAVKDGLLLGAFKDPLEALMPVPAPNTAGITLARDLTSIHVLWEPVGGASSYEVWYSISNRVETARKWNNPIQGTRVEVTGLLNRNTYYFWLKSIGAAGPSGFSGVRSETTGEPLAPAVPVIKWTGRLRNAIFVNWENAANATGYEFRYSAGNNVDTAEYVIPNISSTAWMGEDLIKGIAYNFWVRSRNPVYRSDWSAMGTITVGEGLPALFNGTFFSRYPLSPPGGGSRPYYMDGYQIGPVAEMKGVFPFNKAKYPNPNYQGFPGALAEAGIVREGELGGEIHDDDQYVFYIGTGGGSMIGIVRAVMERPVQHPLYAVDAYVVIEPFLIPGSRSPLCYETVDFMYNLEEPYCNLLMGINGGPVIYQPNLDAEVLRNLGGRYWDAGVAYPGVRLGFLGDRKGLGGPDADRVFHPELIRPELIRQYLAVKRPDLESPYNYNYFEAWNEEKGMYNWQDREQFPAEELMEYVFW
jgi:hypothetical protein